METIQKLLKRKRCDLKGKYFATYSLSGLPGGIPVLIALPYWQFWIPDASSLPGRGDGLTREREE